MKATASTRVFHVTFHIEDDAVWAQVAEEPQWVIGGQSVAEVRDLVIDGVEFVTGDGSPFRLEETFEDSRHHAPHSMT